jgi:Arc/MetJ family transcription regulator
MRTTLDIDRDLLERAKAALGASTYTEAIERSLSRAVEQAELEALLDSLRGEDLVWSLDELRAYRHTPHGDPA